MQDEPLTPEEQDAMNRLPREMPPPAALEDAVVAHLRDRGPLSAPRRPWWATVAAAAVLLLAGFGAGRFALPTASSPDGSQYLLLLYGGQAAAGDEQAARVAEYAAWARDVGQQGQLVSAARLGDQQQVLGVPEGAPPDAASPSGFFLIRAESAVEAAAVAADCPHLRYGGTVVVRRLAD